MRTPFSCGLTAHCCGLPPAAARVTATPLPPSHSPRAVAPPEQLTGRRAAECRWCGAGGHGHGSCFTTGLAHQPRQWSGVRRNKTGTLRHETCNVQNIKISFGQFQLFTCHKQSAALQLTRKPVPVVKRKRQYAKCNILQQSYESPSKGLFL